VVFFVACTPSSTATIKPEQATLSEINLENVLWLQGDFPEEFTVGSSNKKISGTLWDDIDGIDNFLVISFEKDGEPGGFVSVALFSDIDKRNQAFDKFNTKYFEVESSNKKKLDNIGENSFLHDWGGVSMSEGEYNIVHLTFIRCHSFVYLFKGFEVETSVLLTYAKNLDERLSQIVCP
jgi:hypothetical protein